MKTKALAFILSLCLCFSALSVSIFAEDLVEASDADIELSVIDEIKANVPGFDPSNYPVSSDSSIHILGTMEQGLVSDKAHKLFIYIYNPSLIEYLQGEVRLTFLLEGSEDAELYRELWVNLYHYRHSEDNRFVVLQIDLSYFVNIETFREYNVRHKYLLEDFGFFGIRSDGTSFENHLNKTEEYIFELVDGVYNVSVDRSDLVELNVESTTFKVPYANANSVYEHDTVYSVYFSVPDDYVKYYNNIYSVSSSYDRKFIKNLVLSNHPGLSGNNFFSYYKTAVFDSYGDLVAEPTLENNPFPSKFHWCDYFFGRGYKDYFDLILNNVDHSGKYIDYYITYYCNPNGNFIMDSSQVEKMISDIYARNEYVNWDMGSGISGYYPEDPLDLYILSEHFSSSTKTIDQTWDSISFYTSSDFNTYWEEFGFWSAIQYAFYKTTSNNKKLEEFYQKHGFIGTDIEDEPFLLKIDRLEEMKISQLTDQEVSDQYLIGVNDVPAFREYLSTNDNVLLYRFDIQPYSCYGLNVTSSDNRDFSTYGFLTNFTWYENFEVIDVTFKDDNIYTSVGTTHDKLFISPDIEFIPKDDGIDTIGGLKSAAADFSALFKLIGIVIGVIALTVVILMIFKLFDPLRESISDRRMIKALKKRDKPVDRPQKRRRKRK